MKKLLLIIIQLVLFHSLQAQVKLPINTETNRYEFSEVIEINKSKNDLFSNARTFFLKTFQNPNSVIEFQDKEDGRIEGSFAQEIFIKPMGMAISAGNIKYDITILTKDNKYKYIINDLYYLNPLRKVVWNEGNFENIQIDGLSIKGPTKKQLSYINEQIIEHVSSIINDLKTQMNKASLNDF